VSESSEQSPGGHDDASVYAAFVGGALTSLIMRLDTLDKIINEVGADTEDEPDPIEKYAKGLLSQERRKEIDAQIGELARQVPKLASATAEDLMLELGLPALSSTEESFPPTRDEAFAAGMFIARHIVDPLKEILDQYFEDPASIAYFQSRMKARYREPKSEVLGAAILPLVVAAFEQYIASLFRCGLMKYPNAMGELPQAPFELVQKYNQSDIKRYLIDQRIRAVMYQGPEDWDRRIAKWTGIKVDESGIGWERLLEAIQRRHTLIHNGGVVDEDYLRKVPVWARANKSIGTPLSCTTGYMQETLRQIRVFSLILGLRWARHFGKAEAFAVVPNLTVEIYKIEKQGDWSTALRLADAGMELQSVKDQSYDMLRVNWWLCHQKLQLDDAAMSFAISSWEPETDRLRIARAALLKDDNELVLRLQELLSKPRSQFERRDLADMPIMQDSIARSQAVRRLLGGGGHKPKTSGTKSRRDKRGRQRSPRS
jgi:hypothetical protein